MIMKTMFKREEYLLYSINSFSHSFFHSRQVLLSVKVWHNVLFSQFSRIKILCTLFIEKEWHGYIQDMAFVLNVGRFGQGVFPTDVLAS